MWEYWQILTKEKGRYKIQCQLCKSELNNATVTRLEKPCSCWKNHQRKGEIINGWELVEIANQYNGIWKVRCIDCGIEREKRPVDTKKYVCTCKGYQKRKQVCLEKYGKESPMQVDEIKQKVRQTCIEKYGGPSPLSSKEIKQKTKETCNSRYGTDNPMQNKEVQQKVQQTNLERYGVLFSSQNKEVREKQIKSMYETYGVQHALQNPESLAKQRQTMLERFSVESFAQLPENRYKLRDAVAEKPNFNASKEEKEILEWIKEYYPITSNHWIKSTSNISYQCDIFIPEIQLGIEYNGLYWHHEEALKSRQDSSTRYHLQKTKTYEEAKIRLIHIWDIEWQSRKESVKSFLLSAIGKNQFKIGARKCDLVWSEETKDIREVQNFLDRYHIQGKTNGIKAVVKVFYEKQLISVATFGKHHRQNNTKDEWVLSRFCTKMDYTIQGVLSRISKLASQQLQADIISWADYRLSQGNGYLKAGWEKVKLHQPDYFYWKSGVKIISKQSRQKRLMQTPEGMTEAEHAKIDGLKRVWDCGKIKFIYRYKA